MRYRSLLILSLLFVLLAGCKRKEERPFVVPEVFVSQALQDSLAGFVAGIDSIPNPYGAPTAISVTLLKTDEGCDVTFLAGAGLHSSLPGASFYGTCRMGDKPVGFYADEPSTADALVKEGVLDLILPETLDFITYYDPSVAWRGWFPQSKRTYHLERGGDLALTSMQVSNYERFRRQYFGWPKEEKRKSWQTADVEKLLQEIEEFNGVNGPVCALGGKLLFSAAQRNPQAVESAFASHPTTKAASYFRIWFRDLSGDEKDQVRKQAERIKSPAVREFFQDLTK
ncbi:MAG: hypothetical protein J5495_00920 [Bacteroidales bacterium]|nr:hypothetical protein [Bacteroidales bacterium]